MSTLGSEYHKFRNVWEAIQHEKRTVNTLLKTFCALEFRLSTLEFDEFMVRADT